MAHARRHFANLLLAALALASSAFLVAAPVAADQGWTITSFHSSITIEPDSTLSVTEDIMVDFGSQQHHGIFRNIPTLAPVSSSQDRAYALSVQSVTDGNAPRPYSQSRQGNDEVLQIGDPNQLASGPQRYVIAYSYTGVMNTFPDQDQLYWNVDGAAWPVPKQSVSADVFFPAGSLLQSACYQGPAGSKEACTATNASSSAHFASTRLLQLGEQLTLVVGLRPGVVTVPPPVLQAPPSSGIGSLDLGLNPLSIALSLLVLLLGIGFVSLRWWRHGRDQAYLAHYYAGSNPDPGPIVAARAEPIVVEFSPPQSRRPAELGLILDKSVDTKDVTATIVDLAAHGYLTIVEDPSLKDWTLVQKSDSREGLLAYEATILNGLFTNDGRTQVKLSELRGTFASTLKQAEGEIYSDPRMNGMFTRRPDQVVSLQTFAGIALIFGAFFLFRNLFGIALALDGILLVLTAHFMVARTPTGHDLMEHALGFRLYMTTAEKYRQQFAANAGIFTDLLPYAIVFGCVSLWAKAFSGLDTSQSAGWYVGATPFQAALMAANLQAMNATLSSAVSYSPSARGASGFGGGGFAGGGGGGGGGGLVATRPGSLRQEGRSSLSPGLGLRHRARIRREDRPRFRLARPC